MAEDMKSLQDSIDKARNRGIDIIGSIVQWTVPQKVLVDHKDFIKELEAEGLDPSVVPPEVSYPTALRRAVLRFNVGSKLKLEKAKSHSKETGDIYYYAYRLREEKSKEKMEAESNGHVFLHMASMTLCFDSPTSETEWGNRLKSLLSSDHDANDIRSVLKKTIIAANGFPTRPTGGTYFVPESSAGTLDSLDKVMDNISKSDISLTLLPILGDDRTREDLAENFTEEMLREIGNFKQSLEEFFSNGRKKQPAAAKSRVNDITHLQGLAISYEALLAVELSEVNKAVKDLQDFAQKQLDNAFSEEVSSDLGTGIREVADPHNIKVGTDEIEALLESVE